VLKEGHLTPKDDRIQDRPKEQNKTENVFKDTALEVEGKL